MYYESLVYEARTISHDKLLLLCRIWDRLVITLVAHWTAR